MSVAFRKIVQWQEVKPFKSLQIKVQKSSFRNIRLDDKDDKIMKYDICYCICNQFFVHKVINLSLRNNSINIFIDTAIVMPRFKIPAAFCNN